MPMAALVHMNEITRPLERTLHHIAVARAAFILHVASTLPFNFTTAAGIASLEKFIFYYAYVAVISLFESLVTGYATAFRSQYIGARRDAENVKDSVVEAGTVWLCAMITHRDRVRVDRGLNLHLD